ncbi:F0F1 ATP synthase subunit epsilon [Rudaeicoccus suwonensis]|uniref:ATP synthase epsilon chain n=1 Tax=Rudaeicoccus suwonensis TaxID=657409 RepID=A0A561DX66_9MICO|nr:F0F1 ATP synthase subunit epsilon [Rudaeicoccus suwonensis]TWE07968.1 ATP synthase F1 subcomplex epsilon subunit [Rudaeicoccus suwonensis]
MSLTVEIVAADREVWSGEAKQLSCRTVEGDIGILTGHSPLLAVLDSGEMHLDTVDGQRRTLTVDGGFLSVDHDKVTVVAQTVDAPGLDG